MEKINQSDAANCVNSNGDSLLTIVDYRTENFLNTDKPITSIKANCKTIRCVLDELIDPEVRGQIPQKGIVVLLSETGNRDAITMKYLSKYGYSNVMGLRFGMRGWIKSNYPIDISN